MDDHTTAPADAELPPDADSSLDDACWDVFIADDDQLDPDPEPGDFWFEAA